jgi:hypothetical protein
MFVPDDMIGNSIQCTACYLCMRGNAGLREALTRRWNTRAPAPAAGVVTEEMVERAQRAVGFAISDGEMRKALAAARGEE